MGGKRGSGLGRLLAPIALLCATGVSAQSQQAPPPQATPSSAIIVLDGSRSMWTKVGGQSKVAIVRTALGDAFKTYEDRVAFGLVAAGHRQGKTCAEAELIAKPGELSSKTPGSFCSGQASSRSLDGRSRRRWSRPPSRRRPRASTLCSSPTASTAARPMSAPR